MNARVFGLTAFATLCAASASTAMALARGEAPDTPLIVSLPPGGCTLRVFPDGSGNIHYGAAPRIVRVAAQAFDFGQVLQSLRSRMQGRGAETHGDARPGAGVVFPGTNVAERFDDTALVRSLLETGWKSRLPPAGTWHENDDAHAVIKGTCGFD
ncbi:exported hypothetical protein [uncultured Stenotrophomonas sp.]|uniref:Secreted protein n=1 Tax=uncultured Stenotrophomonas sp. TaxID=165438 RepID=A0A1Y5PZ02_9GAMM|nr:exported hypothetical protein [uncultured Stenotrophomonas sp.]